MAVFAWMFALAALAPGNLASLSAREALQVQCATLDAIARPWMTWAAEDNVLEFQPITY